MKVVLASRNRGKLKEFQALLPGLELLSLEEFPEVGEMVEEGETFLENARFKARQVAEATGRPALADDSGLAVEALKGAPGVYSARFAGEPSDDAANNRKLLEEMKGVPWERRRGAFVCCLVLAWPDGREVKAEGRLEGVIALEPRGQNGFGYDPLFYLPALGRTVAELSPEEKNSLSHRAQAARRLREKLGFRRR